MRQPTIQHVSAISICGKVKFPKISGLALAFMFIAAIMPQGVAATPPAESRETGASLSEAAPDYAASRLVGTINGGKSSGAVFENAAGEQKFYRKGETFLDGSRIIAVHPTSIRVKTPEGSVVEYMVTRGTSGKPGTTQAGMPVVEPQVVSNPRAAVDGERSKVPKRKRGRARHDEPEE